MTTAEGIEWHPSPDLLGPPLLGSSPHGEPTEPILNDIDRAGSLSGRFIPRPAHSRLQAFEGCDLEFSLEQQPPLGHLPDYHISPSTDFDPNDISVYLTSYAASHNFSADQESFTTAGQHIGEIWRDFDQLTAIELGPNFYSSAVLDFPDVSSLRTISGSDPETTSMSSNLTTSNEATPRRTGAPSEQSRPRAELGGSYKCEEPGCNTGKLWATPTKLR